ncbi:MAG: tyrosine-protein phosphatase [Oscillospiraceae bacterium]|nr:tyrosine-protein phosphatase [Oscillospiraceae bacterium]
MEGFLLTLNERYGGIRGYLESCALDSVTLETVRSGFVEM